MTRRILKNKPLIEAILEEVIEDIEFDVVVRMPPVKVQTVLVRVKSREKATPHVVEPFWRIPSIKTRLSRI